MDFISDETKELLRKDITGSGITKRNPEKIKSLKERHKIIKELLKDSNVEVVLDLDAGFNSIGFIVLRSAKSVDIYNKEVFEILRDNVAYANMYYDFDGSIEFSFAYTGLTQ